VGFHYLTLKAKKKGPYRHEIAIYHAKYNEQVSFVANTRAYSCLKYRDNDEIRYVYFSADLAYDQLIKKAKRLEKDLIRGRVLSKKVERGKDLGQYISPDG